MGIYNDDISLKLAKAVKQGFLPDVSDSEVDILRTEAATLFGTDTSILGATIPGALINSVRTVVHGDSLTESFDSNVLPIFRSSWFHTLHTLSNGQVRLTENAAHGGYNSPQLQALFDSEVLSFNPTLVIIMPGRNDGQATGAPEEAISYVKEAYRKCKEKGISLVLVNTVPQGQDAIAIPNALTPTIRTTGGTLPVGTFRYVVTASVGASTGRVGETPASNIVSAITSNTASMVKVHWDHVPGANWYRVYKETSDGSGIYGLIKEIVPSNSPGFAVSHYYFDLGSDATSAGVNPPVTNTTALPNSSNDKRARINAWLSAYAAKQGIPLVDVYSKLVDPLTGNYKLGLTYDGTHPNGAGNKIIGQAVWDTLKSYIRPSPVISVKATLDTLNLYSDGTFSTGDVNYATGFTRSTIPSQDVNNQQVGRTVRTGFLGYAQRHENISAGYGILDSPFIATGFSVGDKLLISAKIEVVSAASGGAIELNLIDQASAIFAGLRWVEQDHVPSTVSLEIIIPVGVTSFKFRSILFNKSIIYLGELTVYNLTTNSYLQIS